MSYDKSLEMVKKGVKLDFKKLLRSICEDRESDIQWEKLLRALRKESEAAVSQFNSVAEEEVSEKQKRAEALEKLEISLTNIDHEHAE